MRLKVWTSAGLIALMMGCGDAPAPKGEKSTKAEPAKKTESVATAAAPINPSTGAKPGEIKRLSVEEIYTLPADDGKMLTVEEIKTYLADPKNHEPIAPILPLGLDPVAAFIPADNPMTKAKAELGRLLYFDSKLCRDQSVSCSSCHSPKEGWADSDQFSVGIHGQKGGRQSPTVMNRLFSKLQFWDGRADSLEAQSLGPIANPIEMGFTVKEAVECIGKGDGYKLFFEKIFGGPVSDENLSKAIATFERTVITGGAPNDYYKEAEPFLKMSEEDISALEPEDQARAKKLIADWKAHPMSESALRGRALYFGKADCALCHVGPNLTDELYYNIGVGMDKKKPDEGRAVVTKKKEDTGAFKTPTLRNIALTAPYMHDGSMNTLMEVVDHYDKGGHPNPYQSNRIKKLNLTKQEKEDLVAFMKEGLASPLPNIKPPRQAEK